MEPPPSSRINNNSNKILNLVPPLIGAGKRGERPGETRLALRAL